MLPRTPVAPQDSCKHKKRERLQKKLELQKSLLDKDAEKLNLMLEKATKFIAEIDELNREVKTLSDDVAIQRDRVAEGDYRIKTAERLIRETEWGLGRLEEISTGWQTDLSDSLRTTLDQTKVESD